MKQKELNILKPGVVYECGFGEPEIIKLLGKGKSGYSYLVSYKDNLYVLKIMHNENCAYYNFKDNKVNLEVNAYNSLISAGINIPEMFYHNAEEQIIIKEYIEGTTAAQCIANSLPDESIIEQLFVIAGRVESCDLNPDYFPPNFVIEKGSGNLFYIDYEVNTYTEEWSLYNWGIWYWANSGGMKHFLKTGKADKLNEDESRGIPFKKPFEDIVNKWFSRYR